MNRRMRAVPVYLAYMALDGFFSQMMSVIFSVFLILRLDLGPFQLVLLGTVLEGSYLLFETPTGVVADTISRRTSIVIGLAGGGAGLRAPRARPQLLDGGCLTSGLGHLRDVPERRRRGVAHRRGRGRGRSTALPARRSVLARGGVGGIIVGVALATIDLALPLFVSGAGLLALAAALWIVMPEEGFERRAREEGERLHHFADRDVQGRCDGDALPPRADADPRHGGAARCVHGGVRPVGGPPHPAGHRAPGDRAALTAVVVRDPGRRCAGDRVRRADRRATPGHARRSRPRRADPGGDRRAPRRQRRGVRVDRAVLGGARGDVDRRRAPERARSGVHRVDQPGARPEDARDDQLGRRAGRRGRAGGGGSGARRHRRRPGGSGRDRRLGRAAASHAPAVPSRYPEGNGGERSRRTRSTRCSTWRTNRSDGRRRRWHAWDAGRR